MLYELIAGSGAEPFIQFYVAASLLSAFIFLYIGKRFSERIPRKFVYLHFFVAAWSGLMYMSFLPNFRTIVSDYVWYIDWGISTPLMVTALGLTAFYRSDKVEWDLIGGLAGTQAMMIVSGLLAHTAESNIATMAFFGVGLAFLIRVFYLIYSPIMTAARENSREIYSKYKILGLYIILTWMAYPTIWFLGDPGLRILGGFGTAVAYITMHTVCKYGFGFLNLYLLHQLGGEVE